MTQDEFRTACEAQLGKPYIFGASGPDSFDCSGFAEWALKQLGLPAPGRKNAQGLRDYFSTNDRGDAITVAQIGLGDLCFYKNAAGKICHVTVGWGDGKVIEAGKGDEATTTVAIAHAMGAEVMISDLNRHKRFFDAWRPHGIPWD